eukprot:symbB.v1.2.004539.t1/scaffold256.1/size249868/10
MSLLQFAYRHDSEIEVGSPERKRGRATGSALVPQRAVLFKAVADWLGTVPCTLQKSSAEVVLNVVQVGQTPCVVDLIFDPGALYEETSPKAQEQLVVLRNARGVFFGGAYKRLLTLENGNVEAPSGRRDLAGYMPRPPWHVEAWELEISRDQRIGRGGFGEVFHGRWAGVRVAVKEMKDNVPNDGDVMDFFLEIAMLSQLNHPNIVRFWRGSTEMRSGKAKGSRSLLMVTEYIKQGGLSRLLHGHGGPALPNPLTLPQALSFGLDVARGVQYLHSQRILHLDLKSPNVLCAPLWTAKLLLTKQLPFQEIPAAQLPAAKAAGKLPQLPTTVPTDCSELVAQCCVADPTLRPSMSGVAARVRDIAQSREIQLSEVKPPAALLRFDDDQERRVKEAEDLAAQRLVEVDKKRCILRTELSQLHSQIEEVRKRTAELNTSGAPTAGYVSSEVDMSWCDAFIQEVAGAKFRCALCSKLFRGPEFVKMHLDAKHREEAKRIIEDKYFDCDVSREDAMPIHRAIQRPKGIMESWEMSEPK